MKEQKDREKLKPGGTVVDATSGNTGFSLAMVSAIKGYKCVLTVSSKISEDKLNNLRAMGAEVILCPQEAKPNDPNSYYRMAEKMASEIPGAYYINQKLQPGKRRSALSEHWS
ncbi:MAG: pyridoxal-phosphate dependent enzyme [Saprospiraceae bacterium]